MKRAREVFLVLLVTLGVQLPLLAQSTLGTIVGAIKDQSGAAVPDATINLLNIERGYQRSTKSDISGDYRVPDLMPGTYNLTVEKEGFKRFEQTGVALLTQQTLRLDAALEVGQVTQSVTVSGKAPVVESETTAMGSTTPQAKLDKYIVPLPMMFSAAYFVNYYSLDSVPGGPNPMGAAQARYTSDGMVLDGYQSMPAGVATQEVKIIDMNSPAEFATASTTVTVTKGGTNNFHASAETKISHPALNALGPYPSGRGAQTGSYKASFNGAGPVVIPHLYDGRNRTFFFASFDRAKTSVFSGYYPVFNVPTVAMRAGDFSNFRDSSGNLIPITDPLTGQQFSGNVIPSDRISSVATAFMSAGYEPPPNRGDPNSPFQNWTHVPPIPYGQLASNIIHFRIDQKVSEKDTLNVAFNRYTQHEPLDPGFCCVVEGMFTSPIVNDNWTYTAALTHIISPRMVNEFRAGYSRGYQLSSTVPNGGTQLGKTTTGGNAILKQLGIQGINEPDNLQGVPTISISGFLGMSTPWNQGLEVENRFNYIDNLTMQFGKHSVKVGANYLHGQYTRAYIFGSSPGFGSYSFTGRFTQNGAGAGGSAWADFLLGYPDSVAKYTPAAAWADRWGTIGVYAQDDWKVSPRMTMNLGVRWEMDPVPYDHNGNYYNFDPATGGIVLPDQKALNNVSPLFNPLIPRELASAVGFPAKLVAANKHRFYPRVGIAFRPFNNAKTVLRAAYGIYNAGYVGNGDLFSAHFRVNNGGPFALTESWTNAAGPNGAPFLSMPNPFPDTLGSAASSYSIGATNPNLRPGYEQQWTLAAEREEWGTAFRIIYVGSLSLGSWSRNINMPPPSTIPFDISGCGTFGPRPTPTCRHNYYGFDSINYLDNGSVSSYNALRLEFTRPMANGLYMHGGYIWNNQVDETGQGLTAWDSVTNPYDRRYTRAVANGLPRQRLVIDWLYELPVGKGKHFLASPTNSRIANGAIQGVLGGWSTSAYLAFYGGLPYTITYNGTDPSGMGQFSGRPDRVGSGVVSNPTYLHMFDPSAFTIPASNIGRFGNSGANILWGPGGQHFLLSLFKDFDLTEKLKLRVDAAFNDPFNMKNYGNPNSNISDLVNRGVSTFGGTLGYVSRSIDMDVRLFF